MKPITINVQISKCPKQYESVRLGGEWSVEEGETVEQAMAKAYDELNKMYAELTATKPAPQSKKEEAKADPTPTTDGKQSKQPLTFEKDSETIQAICKRLGAGVALDKVLEYYEPDEQTMHVLKLAAKLK